MDQVPLRYDVIVIGMGLAGLMAAKTAADAGQKVLIVGKGTGSLCLFSHSIDLLGGLPNHEKRGEFLSRWIREHPLHPYAKMNAAKIEEALSSFLSLFPPPYSFQNFDHRNSLLPTGAGTLRPTYLIPETMAPGILCQERAGLVVGFQGFKDFYPGYVAHHLKWRSVTVRLPELPRQEIAAAALARLMEKKSFRERIGLEIKKEMKEGGLVGFPAVLGLTNPMEVKRDLEEIVGAEIFEIPTLPPSIPGYRIFNRFKGWLISKGATLILGNPVSKVSLKGKTCSAIHVSTPPLYTSYEADRFILATGRFVGGGLLADKDKIREPLFGFEVEQPPSREEWYGRSFFSDHPIHSSGIMTDSQFRPVDRRGTLLLENVWIAGTILAHHNSIVEKSREGIEIATGYWAARHALGE